VIHSVVVTPANTADCKMLGQLLHGEETRVYGDQTYKSQGALMRAKAPRAKDFTPIFFSSAIRTWEQSVRSRKTGRESLETSKKSPRNPIRSR
jgi:hypothetical protein